MARVLAVIALFVAFALLVSALFRGQRPRADNTFRPRAGWRDLFGLGRSESASPGLAHVVRRAELAGVRDAYSSATVDSDQPLFRCAGCQSFYGAASVSELAQRNHHRCAVCGSVDIGPVKVVD